MAEEKKDGKKVSKKVRKKLHSIIAAFLICCLCVSGTFTVSGDETAAAAAVMKLSSTEGTVSVSNKNGKNVSVIQGMKLYNGYNIGTEAASYAYISLDSTKAVKLDAVSTAEIRQKGKQLEVLLNSGNLFFNVTEPLKEDETLNIRTSTMVTGIRGTCGWVKKINENVSVLYLLEGVMRCQVTNPVTGETKYIELKAGQRLTATADKEGNTTLVVTGFREADVEGFVAEAIKNDLFLQQRLTAEGIFDVPLIIGQTDDKLKNDQLLTEQKLVEVFSKLAGQDAGKVITPVFTDLGTSSRDSGGSGSSGSSKPSGRQMAQRTMPISAAELNMLLQTSDVTLNAGSGDNNLAIDSGVTVPAGGILNIGSGIDTAVGAGQTLQVDGSLTAEDSVTNNGTINNTSEHTLIVKGIMNNTGTIVNTGRLVALASLENIGTFINENMLEVGDGIVQNGGTMDLGGTITGNVISNTELTLSGNLTGDVVSRGNLTITAGQVNGIEQQAGILTLNGGTVENGITLSDGTQMIMNGGTVYKGTNGAAILYNQEGDGPEVKLYQEIVDGQNGVGVQLDVGTLWLYHTVIRAQDATNMLKGDRDDRRMELYLSDDGVNWDESGINSFIPICTKNENGYIMTEFGNGLEDALPKAGGKTIVLKSTRHISSESFEFGTQDKTAELDLNGNILVIDGKLILGVDGSEESGRLKIMNSNKEKGEVRIDSGGHYVRRNGELELEGIKVEIPWSINDPPNNDTPIINDNGKLFIKGTDIINNYKSATGKFHMFTLTAGTTEFVSSSITSNVKDFNDAVIFASGDNGTICLKNTKINTNTGRHIIEIQGKQELTISGDTEIVGSVPGKGIIYLYDNEPTINYNGGRICNESETSGFAIEWKSRLDSLPKDIGTTIEGQSSDLLGAEAAAITDSWINAQGYEIAQDSVDKYYKLVKMTEKNIALLDATPSNATPSNAILGVNPLEDEEDELDVKPEKQPRKKLAVEISTPSDAKSEKEPSKESKKESSEKLPDVKLEEPFALNKNGGFDAEPEDDTNIKKEQEPVPDAKPLKPEDKENLPKSGDTQTEQQEDEAE